MRWELPHGRMCPERAETGRLMKEGAPEKTYREGIQEENGDIRV